MMLAGVDFYDVANVDFEDYSLFSFWVLNSDMLLSLVP